MHKRQRSRHGFTLIELLVVISIIALLIALLLPALAKARNVARAAMCMSNSRQLATAALGYIYDSNGHFPRSMATVEWDWDTHWVYTLQPYFNDWKILADPGRANPANPICNNVIGNWYWDLLAGDNPRPVNYWVVGHGYNFYDERDAVRGLAARTKIDDVGTPGKSLFSNCIFWWAGGRADEGMYGDDIRYPAEAAFNQVEQKYESTTPGGIHNGTETFTFLDGHTDMYSTTPIHEWFLTTNTTAFTYPPGVDPIEAQWWTVPYYPEYYPYTIHKGMAGYTSASKPPYKSY